MIRLPDVNVLIALAWPNHMHHVQAHRWFASVRREGWATCPATEAGLVRLSGQPAVTKVVVPMSECFDLLERNVRAADHHFWPQQQSLREIHPDLRARIMGPRQLGDAILLDLAARNGGLLATFDRRILDLPPSGSPLRSSVEVLPLE